MVRRKKGDVDIMCPSTTDILRPHRNDQAPARALVKCLNRLRALSYLTPACGATVSPVWTWDFTGTMNLKDGYEAGEVSSNQF